MRCPTNPAVYILMSRLRSSGSTSLPGEGVQSHRDVDGPRVSRRHAAVLLAAAAIVIALVYAGAQAQDAAREADANRQAVAAAKRASDFANVLALHETIFAASRRTTRVFRAERGRMNTASARARLTEAVVPLEGLAFILRRGLAPIPSAADIWQRYLVCSFYTARAGVGPALDREVPELARFAQARRPAIDGARTGLRPDRPHVRDERTGKSSSRSYCPNLLPYLVAALVGSVSAASSRRSGGHAGARCV